jgi:hypothetical protein
MTGIGENKLSMSYLYRDGSSTGYRRTLNSWKCMSLRFLPFDEQSMSESLPAKNEQKVAWTCRDVVSI